VELEISYAIQLFLTESEYQCFREMLCGARICC
jgi:hypothetical protein